MMVCSTTRRRSWAADLRNNFCADVCLSFVGQPSPNLSDKEHSLLVDSGALGPKGEVAHWINLGPLIDYLATRAYEDLGTFLIGTSGNQAGCGNPTSKTFVIHTVDEVIRLGVDFEIDVPHWSNPDFDEKGRWLSAPMLDVDQYNFYRPGKHQEKANVIASVFKGMGSDGRNTLGREQLRSFFDTLRKEGTVEDEEKKTEYACASIDADAVFDSIDADKSGDISFNELYHFLFEMGGFQVNVGRGYIKDELRKFMLDRGMQQVNQLTTQQFDALFARIDTDNSGDVNFYEFWDFFGKQDAYDIKQFNKEQMFDYMVHHGMDSVKLLSKRQYDRLFSKIDKDGSGVVDFFEFWMSFGNRNECRSQILEIVKSTEDESYAEFFEFLCS